MVINSQLAPCQQSYRITLDLTVDEDFNPRQIDFNKVFNLSEWESINTHIEEFQKPSTLHFTGPASSVFLLSTIGGQYITLYGLQFGTYIKKSLYVAPKVFPQCKERIGGKVQKAPTEIQVLISTGKSVRIGFLQTSKNWESLEGVIKKLKVGCFRPLSHRGLFYDTLLRCIPKTYFMPIFCYN